MTTQSDSHVLGDFLKARRPQFAPQQCGLPGTNSALWTTRRGWTGRPARPRFVARQLVGSRIGFLAASRQGSDGFFESSGLSEHWLRPWTARRRPSYLPSRIPTPPPPYGAESRKACGNPLTRLCWWSCRWRCLPSSARLPRCPRAASEQAPAGHGRLSPGPSAGPRPGIATCLTAEGTHMAGPRDIQSSAPGGGRDGGHAIGPPPTFRGPHRTRGPVTRPGATPTPCCAVGRCGPSPLEN